MTVAGLIFLFTGFLMEILWLYNTSGSPKRPGWLRYFLYIEGGILVLAVFLARLAVLMGKAEITLSGGAEAYIMIFVFCFIFFYHDALYDFMPRVTEQSILVVLFISFVSLIQLKPDLPKLTILIFTAVSPILMIWLIASKKKISSVMKIFVYFWYMLVLLLQSAICRQPLEHKETCLSLSECFLLGVYYSFFSAHFSFLAYIWTNIKALWPHFDGEFATRVIKPFFFDDQISLLPFLIFISSTGGATYLLYHFRVPRAGLWANMIIVFIVQVLFNPYIKYWFKQKLNLVD